MNTDNYGNKIIEQVHPDQYTTYELVADSINGYYVNIHYTDLKKREIISKFQNSNSDNSNNFFFVMIFWQALIEKIKKYA